MDKIKYRWINGALALAFLLPIFILVVWAFTARWPWPQLFPQEWTWRGFSQLWQRNQNFSQLIFSSVTLSLLVAFLSVCIGFLTSRAYLMVEKRWASRLIYGLVSLPFLVPAVVFGMGIHQLMIRLGWANTFFGVMLAHLVYSLPYATYLILDAYQSFGFRYEEQARILGASSWQSIRLVTWPLLLPVLSTSFAMSYVVSFSQYFLTLLLGGGQVQTFALVMFPYLQNNDRTIASNYGLLFLLITLAVFLIFERLSAHYQKKYQLSSYY